MLCKGNCARPRHVRGIVSPPPGLCYIDQAVEMTRHYGVQTILAIKKTSTRHKCEDESG